MVQGPLEKRSADISEKFSQDWEVFSIVTHPLKLATYAELATVFSVEDAHNMLEIMDAKDEMDDISRIRSEQKQASQQ